MIYEKYGKNQNRQTIKHDIYGLHDGQNIKLF